MDLRRRAALEELMDAPGVDDATYARCLHDLASVNRVTGTHRPTLHWLARATATIPKTQEIAVLDVAQGQGDLLRAIAAWAARTGRQVRLVGIDLNPRAAAAARAATPPGLNVTYVTGDVFAYRPDQKFDFIVTSQFTHHLPDAAVARLLAWMEANAARGWHVADLHRHAFAYYGFRWLARLFGWHRIVRYDGTVSIARGFRRAEWAALLARAQLAAETRWHWGFRYGVSRVK